MRPLPPSEVGTDGRLSGLRGWWQRRGPVGRLASVLLLFPATNALLTLAVLAYSGSGAPDEPGLVLFSIAVAIYSLVGPAALAALIWVASRHAPLGMTVVAVTCLVSTAATVWSHVSLVQDLDESSTAALGFLFLPAFLAILLIPFVGVTALVHWLRARGRVDQARNLH